METVSAQSTITLADTKDGVPIEGAVFHIYHVADWTENNGYEMEPEFTDSGVKLEYNTGTAMYACAATLEAYLVEQQNLAEKIQPLFSGRTDEEGQVTFADLTDGIYLITGDELTEENQIYTPAAMLVALPYQNADGNYDSSVRIEETNEVRDAKVKDTQFSLSAVEIWMDDGYEEQRPKSVTVTLFQDGVLYDQAILNKDNNWRHTWEKLDESSRWQLAEWKVPQLYSVETVREDNVFVVTNIYQPQYELAADEKADVQEDAARQMDAMIKKLSWTGELQVSAPLFAMTGLALLSLGYGIYRRWKDEEKEEPK